MAVVPSKKLDFSPKKAAPATGNLSEALDNGVSIEAAGKRASPAESPERKPTTVYLDSDLKAAAKKWAIDHDTTLTQVIADGIKLKIGID